MQLLQPPSPFLQNKIYTLFFELLKKKANIKIINDVLNFDMIQKEGNRTSQGIADWKSNNKEKFEMFISKIDKIINQN